MFKKCFKKDLLGRGRVPKWVGDVGKRIVPMVVSAACELVAGVIRGMVRAAREQRKHEGPFGYCVCER